jgi:hypothetical protein
MNRELHDETMINDEGIPTLNSSPERNEVCRYCPYNIHFSDGTETCDPPMGECRQEVSCQSGNY